MISKSIKAKLGGISRLELVRTAQARTNQRNGVITNRCLLFVTLWREGLAPSAVLGLSIADLIKVMAMMIVAAFRVPTHSSLRSPLTDSPLDGI